MDSMPGTPASGPTPRSPSVVNFAESILERRNSKERGHGSLGGAYPRSYSESSTPTSHVAQSHEWSLAWPGRPMLSAFLQYSAVLLAELFPHSSWHAPLEKLHHAISQ